MPLSPGDKLGPYEIIGPLGQGGMGEVWKARDTRLNRIVAIKQSHVRFSERIEREAHAIAALNHPHICQVYDVGPDYLVLEYIEGQPVRGPVPVNEALTIAGQVLDALDAAHRKGITHRDLKPDNILVGKAGVKILDFGLAKMEHESGESSEVVATKPLTAEGTVLGTLQYMSPEQIEGQEADARSDIFAFGLVLYELITGRRAFEGKTRTSLVASILKDQPRPLSELQPLSPPALERVVATCLEKDPDKRWQSAREVKHALEWISSDMSKLPATAPARRKWLWPAVAAVGVVAGAALALWAPWRKPAPTQAVRFEVGPAEKMTFISGGAMAVSPDGRWMVFPATGEDGMTRYYIRSLDGVEVRALPGTEDVILPPASWSHDSRWVIFATRAKIKRVDIQGGPPQELADFPGYLNGAGWNSDGVIIAGSANSGNPILRVPASGGQASPVTALAPGESDHVWPQFLPDGKHFLYERVSSDPAKAGVYVGSIDAQPKEQSMQRLLASDRQAYYAPPSGGGTGHLIFLRQGTLMAQSFDPSKLTLSGEPSAIADGVDSYAARYYGLFSVSDTGAMVYRSGGSGTEQMLTWFDQQGNPAGTLGDPGDYWSPAVSPDDSRVAVAMGPAATRNIWILDVARGSRTRFTFDPAGDDNPAWSPDGKNIAFSSNRGGQIDLYVKPADGSGEEKLLLKTGEQKYVESWTKDGRFLLFTSLGPKTGGDMWALPFAGEAKPVALLQTQFSEGGARVSSDGRWLAYNSNESGAPEVYVRPFSPEAPAGTGAKWLVSKGGGVNPIWRSDGKELFYPGLASQMMAVDIDTSKGLQAGTPRRLFTAPGEATTLGWDLAPDGKRFLFIAPPGTGRTIPFTVVLNWAAGLKK